MMDGRNRRKRYLLADEIGGGSIPSFRHGRMGRVNDGADAGKDPWVQKRHLPTLSVIYIVLILPSFERASMASHTKGRTGWNAVMKDTYGINVVNKYNERFKRTTRGVEKRQSTRMRKVSKALLAMNAEERRGIEDERMNALDEDNHRQDEVDADDSDFEDSEEEEDEKPSRGKRKRGGSMKAPQAKKKAKNALARRKFPKKIPFAIILMEDEDFRQRYTRALTQEGPHPRQRFCAVTGQPARYKDPATGTPYATVEAFQQIREKAPPILLR
jgi:hypothetical protein